MQDNVIEFIYDASAIPDTEFVPAPDVLLPSAQLDLPQDDHLTTITNGPLSSVEVIPAAGEGKQKDKDVTFSEDKEEVAVTDEPEDINLEIDAEKLSQELFEDKTLEQLTAEREKLQAKYEEVLNEEGNADEMAFLVKIIELYDNKIEELEQEQHRKEVLAAKDVIFKPEPKHPKQNLETAEEVTPESQEPAPETQFVDTVSQDNLASADVVPTSEPVAPETQMQTPTEEELLETIDVLDDAQTTPEVSLEDEAQAGLLDTADSVPVSEDIPEADNFASGEEETVTVNLSNQEELRLADLVSEQIKTYGEDSIYRQDFLDKVKKELKANDLEDDELLELVTQVATEVQQTLQPAPDTQMSDDVVAAEMSSVDDILNEDAIPETQLSEEEAPIADVGLATQAANRELLNTVEEAAPEQEELIITDDDFVDAPEQDLLNTAETIVLNDERPTEIRFVDEDGQLLDTVEVTADNPAPQDVEFQSTTEEEPLASADYIQLHDEAPAKDVTFQHSRPRLEMLGTADEIPFVDDEVGDVEFESDYQDQPLNSAEQVVSETKPSEVEFHRADDAQPLDSADEYLTLEEDDTPEVEFAREQPRDILDSADRFLPESDEPEPIADDFNFATEQTSDEDLLSDYDLRHYQQQLDDLYFQRNRLYETLDNNPNDEETQELIALVEQEILKIQAVLGLGDDLEAPVTSDTLSVEEQPRVHIVHKQEAEPVRDAYAEYQAKAPARITSAEEVAADPKVEDVEFMPNAGGKLTDAWKTTKGALETAANWMKTSKTASELAKNVKGAAKVGKIAVPAITTVAGGIYAGSNGGNLWKGITNPIGYGNEKTAKAVYQASLNEDIDEQTLYNSVLKANKGFTGFFGDPADLYKEEEVARDITNQFTNDFNNWKTSWISANGSNPTASQVSEAKKAILQNISSNLTGGTTKNLSAADINAAITPATTTSLLSGLTGTVNNNANQELEAQRYINTAYASSEALKETLLDAGYGLAEIEAMSPYELMQAHKTVEQGNSKYLNRYNQAKNEMAKNLSLYEQYIVNGDANKKGNWDPENNPNDKVLQEAGFDGSGMTPAELLQARNSIKDNEAIKVAAQTQAATRNKQIVESAVNSLKNSLGAGLTDSSNNPSGRQATSLIRDALGTDLGASASQLITDINSADVQTRQTILKTVQEYTNRLAQLDQGRYAAALDDQTLLNSLGLRQDYIDTIRAQMQQMDAQERQEALTWLGVASQLMGNLSEEYSADAQDINTLMARYALSQLFSKTGLQLA